ncbi:hypothetical protein BVC80_1309g15 [Macleaya cordata]|uniref:Uncharacterized protein n=1 Tax=Macleaya cordata TaxID=56857 RepID=A0A200R399_MACCD|nr:hypothetical protein BVC80_1309g15 [Macleaya cordata]
MTAFATIGDGKVLEETEEKRDKSLGMFVQGGKKSGSGTWKGGASKEKKPIMELECFYCGVK